MAALFPRSLWFSLIGVALLLAAPLAISSGRWIDFLELTLFVAVLAQAWNILGGYGGQYSFGHALFFGMGAYVQALLQFRFGVSPWAALPIAIGSGAALGALVGFLSFRYGLRGSYFALVTLAFAEAFHVLARSLVSVTEGGRGVALALNQDPELALTRFQFNFAPEFLKHAGYYYTILALFLIANLIVWRMERTRFGAQLVSVRENEDAAEALGVNAFWVKMQAIMLSGAIAASAGVYYVQKFLYVDPGIAFGPGKSVEALVAAIIGGLGTVIGPLLGAAFLHSIAELAKEGIALFAEPRPGLDVIFYGLLLLLALGYAPKGVAGVFSRWFRRGGSRGDAS